MKLTTIILFIACLQVSARGHSQKLVTLDEKNGNLTNVLEKIRQQTSMVIWYRADLLLRARPVTIHVKNETVQKVFEILFRDQPLTYSIVDNAIFIKPKENAEQVDKLKTNLPIDVSGRITNEKGDPVVGATISVKNSSKSTVTNANGEFTLEKVDVNDVLTISSIGYDASIINIGGRRIINTILKIKVTNLDEFQVIAYGQVTKRFNTGNVSTVKASDIEKQPVSNPLLALQGRVPGMQITQSTGVPGGGVRVEIRGKNSISQGTDPLYIIDGVPYPSQSMRGYAGVNILLDAGLGSPFNYINPADIESIDILKDADATAIYGSRGTNGVVLITTKKGKSGKTKVDFNFQTGIGKVSKMMDLLNTQQYLEMRREAFRNDGAQPNPNMDYDLLLWDTTRYTDWQKELIGGTALYNDLQVSLSGGNTSTQFLLGTGYHKETTVFPGNYNDQKGSVHFNLRNTSLDNKFKVSFTGLYTIDNNRLSPFNFASMAVLLPPNAPAMYNEDGSFNWAPNSLGASTWPRGNGNPAATLASQYNMKTKNLISNATLSYEIIKGLQFIGSFGYNNLQTDQFSAVPFSSIDPYTWPISQRSSTFVNTGVESWIIEPQAHYTTQIAKGVLTALLGSSIQRSLNQGKGYGAFGFSSDLLMSDIRSATNVLASFDDYSLYKYHAVFGRINYNWKEKYLLNINVRRDGSSRFGPANRFHNFGSLGAGWIFSNEEFFKKRVSVLSFGKIRGSYGTTGNDQVGDYSFLDLYRSSGTGALPYQGIAGIGPLTLYIPDLAWEETRKLEAGLELGFLNDRIYLSSSFYRNRSSNQLVGYLLPGTTGFTSTRKNLDALVENKGLEFELRTTNIRNKNFRWNSAFNVSLQRNKLISIGAGAYESLKQTVGNSTSSIRLYKSLGVDPVTGKYKYATGHGGETYTPDPVNDLTVLLDLNAKYYGGFQNSIGYKGFQLDVLFQFVNRPNSPLYLFNYIPGAFNSSTSSGSNQPASILNRWQKPGDVKPYTFFSQNGSLATGYINSVTSDMMYANASFVRLKNASLSWQVPDNWKKRLRLLDGKIYIQGQNLLTISNYKGVDPETQNTGYSQAPLTVITAGVKVSL